MKERERKLVVRWCLNEACSLYGHECYENQCTRCGTPSTKLVWSLIICEPRGVYMGLCEWAPGELPKAITVYCCRSCVWYRGMGSQGLATSGPTSECRITGALDEVKLANPKSLHAVTSKALSAWEDEPWSKT